MSQSKDYKQGPGEGPNMVADPLTNRRCRKCKKRCPTSLYFHCRSCYTNMTGYRGDGRPFGRCLDPFDWGYVDHWGRTGDGR